MKRVVMLAIAAVAVIPAASVESARPPALLTYGVAYGSRGPIAAGGGLCVARADGSGALRLTPRRDDRTPAWSPNGKYVAFARQFAGDRIFDVLLADARGRVIRNLSDGQSVMETSPTWSPDSRRLAFAGGWRGSGVWIADRAGTYVNLFLGNAAHPAWSPDGRRLAFTSFARESFRDPSLWTIRLNRSESDLVAENASHGTWSPDATKLAFVRHTGPNTSEIAVANADGSEPRDLTRSAAQEFAPAWSPNGKWIAFERTAAGDEHGWIVVVDAATGAERWTIKRRYAIHEPSWRRPAVLPRARRGSCR
jgi:TolB protein